MSSKEPRKKLLTEHVQGVAGEKQQLARVHAGSDIRSVGPQGIGGQAQALLGGAAHEHQRYLSVQKAGTAVEIRFHDLQRGAAAPEVVHVLQVAVEVADLRKQNFSSHCPSSFASSISFSFAFTRNASGMPSTP